MLMAMAELMSLVQALVITRRVEENTRRANAGITELVIVVNIQVGM